VHPLIQCARGALSDEDIVEAERLLGLAAERAKDLEDENERLTRQVRRRDELLDRCRRDRAELRGASDENQDGGSRWPSA
jgi:hypothetical protein